MNRKILQKVIDALNIGTPDKVMYAIGALDSLMESLPEPMIAGSIAPIFQSGSPQADDEAKALEYMAAAKLEAVKQMAGE